MLTFTKVFGSICILLGLVLFIKPMLILKWQTASTRWFYDLIECDVEVRPRSIDSTKRILRAFSVVYLVIAVNMLGLLILTTSRAR